ncbi:MAG: PAS domain S-box protein [bacterium]
MKNKRSRELLNSVKTYRKILDSLNDGILLVDDTIVVDCNTTCLNILDLKNKKSILHKRINEIIPENEINLEFHNQVTGHVQSYNIKEFHEIIFHLPGGKVRNVEATISRNIFKSKKQFLISLRDITRKKRFEMMQDTIYKIVYTAATSASLQEFIHDIQNTLSTLVETSNFYVALYNSSDDTFEFPYMSDDMDHFKTAPAAKTLSGYVLKTKKSLLANKSVLKKLEKKGEIELVGSDCKIWLGVPLRVQNEVIGILGVQSYTDENAFNESDREFLEFISNQIGISITRKRAEDALRVEKAYFERLFRFSPEGIVITDIDGNILRVNEAFLKLFGHTENEIIGQNLDKTVSPDFLMEEARALTDTILSGKSMQVETKRKKKNGELIDVSILGTPIEPKKGVVAGYAIYRDITQKLQYEEKLRIAKEKAEESDRLKTAFLANMSHEIRTPMNAIIGFSDLLIDSDDLDNQNKKEYLNIIKNNGIVLIEIIDDILDLSKMETGQFELVYKPCKINRLIYDLYNSFLEIIKESEKPNIKLHFTVDSPDAEFNIIIDQRRINQVLKNLLNNALRLTEKGTISFGYRLKENKIEFFVKDTGIGLDEAEKNLIFKRFNRVNSNSTNEKGGTGLSLAISKNIIDLMEGEIFVVSEKEKGTEFLFSVPLRNSVM